MNRWSPALLTLVLLFTTGCAATQTANPFDGAVQGDRTIRIEVRNFNFADATLFARRGSQRIRMGVVTGKTDRNFDVPWTISVPLQVEINLLAGDRCITPPRNVEPGEVILLQIPINLSNDSDCV